MYLKIADITDRVDFEKIACDMHRLSPMSTLEYKKSNVFAWYDAYLQSDRTSKMVIIAKEGIETVGLIACLAEESLFTHGKIAGEINCWSKNKRITVELYRAFEFWARKIGCVMIAKGKIVSNLPSSKFTDREILQFKEL